MKNQIWNLSQTWIACKVEKNSDNDDGSSSKESQDLIEKEHSDGIEDLFQIEIVEGEKLYACNVCNEGFEKDDDGVRGGEFLFFRIIMVSKVCRIVC